MMRRKGSGDGHLFSQGPRLGNLEEDSSTGDFDCWMKGLCGWDISL